MSKRRKEEPPSPDPESRDLPTLLSGRDNALPDSPIHCRCPNLSRYDSEIPDDEMDDVFNEVDEAVPIIIDSLGSPLTASSPMRQPSEPNRLAPIPHNFRRTHIHGSLTPQSYSRLRLLSEGSNEEFLERLNSGVLSHPDIQADVIAARLTVIADRLNDRYYSRSNMSPGDDSSHVLNEIASRLRIIGIAMDYQYFSQPSFLQNHRRILAGCFLAAIATTTILWLKS
ncbi:uncharacterized protein LOC134817152 isoform X3 [Bolinopsis microptera]|uniref:uncharacterized protein LOC134817152 isoform X3 n=1 Tax=Bolinopsis microptera TaxID=2820187 RepID=UPI0030790534